MPGDRKRVTRQTRQETKLSGDSNNQIDTLSLLNSAKTLIDNLKPSTVFETSVKSILDLLCKVVLNDKGESTTDRLSAVEDNQR